MKRSLLAAIASLSLCTPALGTVLANWSFDEVVARADLIVIGTVSAQRPVWEGQRLLTENDVAVERVLMGEAPAHVVVTQLGGKVGDYESEWVGVPLMVPGSRVVLATYSYEGRRYIVGMALGAFTIHGEKLEQDLTASVMDAHGRILAPPGQRAITLPALLDVIARRRR